MKYDDIKPDEDYSARVYRSEIKLCEPHADLKQRRLNGGDRDDVKAKLLSGETTTGKLYREAMLSSNVKKLHQGDKQTARNKETFYHIRKEITKQEEKDKDSMTDLHNHVQEMHKNHDWGVTSLSMLPFGVTLILPEALALLESEHKKYKLGLRPPIVAYFDATGGITKKMTSRVNLHHAMVVPVDCGKKSSKLFSVMEYLTDTSTGYNLAKALDHLATHWSTLGNLATVVKYSIKL